MADEPEKVTAKMMQGQFYIDTTGRYELVAPNTYPDWQFNEMDIFALRKSGYLDEIEIKLSVSDFKADFKKIVKIKDTELSTGYAGREYYDYTDYNKHECLKKGLLHCNRFSFLIPEGMQYKIDIPDYAGLYVYRQSRIRGRAGYVTEVKSAPVLHKNKITDEMKYKVACKMAYRYWREC